MTLKFYLNLFYLNIQEKLIKYFRIPIKSEINKKATKTKTAEFNSHSISF